MASPWLIACICYCLLNPTFGFLLQKASVRSSHLLHRSAWLRKAQATEIDLNKSILKVPSTAWRWPPQWPFQPTSFEKLSGANLNLTTIPTGLYLDHLRQHVKLEGQKVLFICDKSHHPSYGESSLRINSDVVYSTVEDFGEIVKQFPHEHFDAIIVLGAVHTVTSPLELYFSLWQLLKFSGQSFSIFPGARLVTSDDGVPIKLWAEATDEQRIWITGAYYHYSQREGWTNLEAFDITGTTGDQLMQFTVSSSPSSLLPIFAVHANKIALPDLDSEEGMNKLISLFLINDDVSITSINAGDLNFNADANVKSNLEELDRTLLSLRLSNDLNGEEDVQEVKQLCRRIRDIYSVLKDVQDTVIPKPAKAALASLVVKQWRIGDEVQRDSLKRAVGLATPDEEFWLPLGQSTASMYPMQKIFLLADIINSMTRPDRSAMLARLPSLIVDAQQIISNRLSEVKEADVQTFAASLCLSDYLLLEQSVSADPAERLLRWLRTCSLDILEQKLTDIASLNTRMHLPEK